MTIEALIVDEAFRNLEVHGQIKNMDPMAQHLLKTSDRPLLRWMRTWMRETAIRQAMQAEREQKKLNAQVNGSTWNKGSLRLTASLAPYYAAQMPKMHGTTWNDKDFIGSVREGNPKIFPKRDG